MNIAIGLESFRPGGRPVSLALGTFDGLHKGHRAVIDALRRFSEAEDGEAVVTTFDPHPLTVVAPPTEPFLLTTLEERIELFRATGIDTLVVVRFDQRLRMLAAQTWLERIEQHLHPRRMVISSTHAFGHNREGNPAMLHVWAAPRRIDVAVVPAVTADGVVVSSTAVRERLRAGDVGAAGRWLGRWYTVQGTVIAGAGRGRTLGVPTANLGVPREKLVPAYGVYAAYATVDRLTYPAAVNIGVRPTFGGDSPTVEAHLIDVKVELYGRTLELAFVERLRPERQFPDASALRAQLTGDLASARRILAERQPEAV
ncbi:MAG TPA: riboflavin biosynthesis protein RibF [bacterium]|nr:riboflavin biosynthesis protein RibF [bacterium]